MTVGVKKTYRSKKVKQNQNQSQQLMQKGQYGQKITDKDIMEKKNLTQTPKETPQT